MKIGAGRPLCCFFWALSCAVALYVFVCPNASALAIFAAAAAAVIACLAALSVLCRRRRFHFLYVAFVILGLLAGLVSSLLYEHFTVRPAYAYASAHSEEPTELCGLVVCCESESSYISAYGVRTRLPDGRKCMTYLRVTGESVLSVGDEIRTAVTVCPITETDGPAWFVRYLRAKGYLLTADAQDVTSESVVSEGHFVLRKALAGVQDQLSYRLSRAVGGEQGRLASALLVGTRSELSDMTVLDFRRAGASHLLALSGLHLSMIVLMLGALLRFLRCPYWLRMALLCAVAVVFLLLTGCSISMLRATVMLLFLYASRLRGAPHDALTPLSAFFGVCLAIRPTWILDIGLWLTVLATLSVVEIVPALVRGGKQISGGMLARLRRYLGVSLGGSAVVLLMLMIPMAAFFGEFSWLSPVANLLLTPLTSVVLGVGMLTLPLLYLADIVPALTHLSEALCDALHALTEAMLNVTATLSDVKGALISLRYGFVPYLLSVLLVIVLLFLLFKWKRPVRFVGALGVWSLAFCACLVLTHIEGAGKWQATYTVHGKSELLTLNEAQVTVLCDLTDGSYTAYRDLLADGLPKGTTEIEALVLTHYHQRHIASVYKLLGDCRVRTVFLPMTMPDATQNKAIQDEGILRSIAALARERRVQVCYYIPSEGANVADGLRLERLYYSMLKRSTHPTLALSWQYRQAADGRLVLVGASAWEGKLWREISSDIAACDALVLSGHGPIMKTNCSAPAWQRGPSTVLFANGNAAAALSADAQTAAMLHDAKLHFADHTHTRFKLP